MPGMLAQRMRHTPYQAYSYAYPHKSAYRTLASPRPLDALWAQEDRSALFAYIHLPFCTMRCGFCNLFAMARPADELVDAYVDSVVRQMRAMDQVLGARRFARFALGGGTPTYLSARQLERLFQAADRHLGIDLQGTPSGIEASPETVTADRLAVCRDHGIDRVSLGIQSFSASEVRALARPQQNEVVTGAIEKIRQAAFPVLNLDLIYGIAGQTVPSMLASLASALVFAPEEIYLYPLYVREQTGLGKMAIRQGTHSGDERMALYLAARDHLRAAGYAQVSMRMFRAPHAPQQNGPAYCCQSDGMVGLGAGARSYTARLHYSSAYAVERAETRQIIESFTAMDDQRFMQAEYGFALDASEQRRRHVIQSLLTEPGLSFQAYRQRFGTECLEDFPQLNELTALSLARLGGDLLCLTDQGFAHADTIGPWLISPRVEALMDERSRPC